MPTLRTIYISTANYPTYISWTTTTRPVDRSGRITLWNQQLAGIQRYVVNWNLYIYLVPQLKPCRAVLTERDHGIFQFHYINGSSSREIRFPGPTDCVSSQVGCTQLRYAMMPWRVAASLARAHSQSPRAISGRLPGTGSPNVRGVCYCANQQAIKKNRKCQRYLDHGQGKQGQ